jgi:hypothetical protein
LLQRGHNTAAGRDHLALAFAFSAASRASEGLSRRVVLAGVASAAALPIAAAMPANAEQSSDPIFAAIETWRRADAACVTVDGDIPDELGDRLSGASKAVMRTRPITPAGLAALTSWARELADEIGPHSTLLAEDFCALTATIDDAARGMSGLKPWAPVASGRKNPSDPIFAIIDKHRAATTAWKEAVRVEFAYEKCRPEVEAMDPVERGTYQSTFDSLQEATGDAGDQMHEASIDLVNTPPSSLAGIIALCEYFGPQADETHNLPDEIDWDDGTQSTPAGAFANAIRSAVAAMVQS